eukprot:10977726-Alexandrium_andersonii.AAC.1
MQNPEAEHITQNREAQAAETRTQQTHISRTDSPTTNNTGVQIPVCSPRAVEYQTSKSQNPDCKQACLSTSIPKEAQA